MTPIWGLAADEYLGAYYRLVAQTERCDIWVVQDDAPPIYSRFTIVASDGYDGIFMQGGDLDGWSRRIGRSSIFPTQVRAILGLLGYRV